MIGRVKAGAPEDVVARLADALKLAANDKDKRALLGEAGQHPCAASLDLALEYLKQPEIANEAGVAAIQAASTLDATQRDRVKVAMRAVIAAAPSRDVDKQADALLRKTTRPANLALGATATSPDNLDSDGAASGDQAAIDGNPDTYWDEVDNQPLYILDVTFKEPTRVAGLCIKGHAYHSHSPKDFTIVCDGSTVKTVQNAEYDQSTNEFVAGIPATTCKTIELRITSYYGGSPGIRELEIYATNPEEAIMESAMPNPPQYRWQQAADSLALMNRDRVVWQFNYGKDLPKSYFSPVTLGGGMELTWLSPPDHWWHRGLWFSWKELNGINYWEEDKDRHCQGCNEVVAVKTTPNADANSARIEMTISYHPPSEPPVLTEERVMMIGPPDAQGGYSIDWRSDFSA
ncbi:MAG: PmoA family protein, partial [Candidatus Hydrogenedentes bacterium]|nr:PmoA family protein [Candidatus Hydrogenedentota bacterium]